MTQLLYGLFLCALMAVPAWAGGVAFPPGAGGGACANCMVTDAANLINAIAAPGTPASGKGNVWLDSTSKTLKIKDDAGADSTTVRADAGASNNFLTAISASGVISKAQPSSSNLSDAATLAKLTANTFTATQTVNPANNTSALVSSGSSLTGSDATPLVDLSRTWNTTGTPTAFKLAITDTASNASSSLMELLAGAGGATSMFKVRRDGQVTTAGPMLVPDGTAGAPSVGWISDADGTGTGIYRNSANRVSFVSNGARVADIYNQGSFFTLDFAGAGRIYSTSLTLGDTSSSINIGASDLQIYRDAAGIFAQRNGVNAQTHRVYGTFTDISNGSNAALGATSTAVTLAAETRGTGAANIPINITPAGTGKISLNGETTMTGISADGTGKVACVKSDGNMGSCTDLMNTSGVCTCA